MNEVLNKPNQLISLKSRDKITAIQKKAYNIFLKNAQNIVKFQNEFDGVNFKINANELYEKSGILKKDDNYLKKEMENLMRIIVNVTSKDNKEDWEAFPLLRYIKKKGETYEYKLDETIIEALKNQSFFTPLNLLIIGSLSSQYSVIFYELAIRYKKYKIPKMTLDEVKELTGTRNQYKAIKDFRKRVLDIACEEISEKTDIILSYKTERLGRRVAYVDFKISKKNKKQLEYIESKEELKNIFEEPIADSIEDNLLSELEEREIKKVIYKIPFEVAKCLFEKYREKESFEFFIYCLEKTEKESIKNPLTYFEKIIEIDSVKSEFKIKKHNQELKKKEQLEKEEKTKKKEEVKVKDEQKINYLIEFIMSEKGETYNEHKKDVLFALIKGFVEDKKYIFKSEEEIPEEIIEKYIRISLKQDLMY